MMKLDLASKELVRGYETRKERAGQLRVEKYFLHCPFPKAVSTGCIAIRGEHLYKILRGKIKWMSLLIKRY